MFIAKKDCRPYKTKYVIYVCLSNNHNLNTYISLARTEEVTNIIRLGTQREHDLLFECPFYQYRCIFLCLATKKNEGN